jgi:hypothetical protein
VTLLSWSSSNVDLIAAILESSIIVFVFGSTEHGSPFVVVAYYLWIAGTSIIQKNLSTLFGQVLQ